MEGEMLDEKEFSEKALEIIFGAVVLIGELVALVWLMAYTVFIVVVVPFGGLALMLIYAGSVCYFIHNPLGSRLPIDSVTMFFLTLSVLTFFAFVGFTISIPVWNNLRTKIKVAILSVLLYVLSIGWMYFVNFMKT